MNRMRFLMPIGFLAVAAGFSAIVMLLWNCLMPVIFGLPDINFWQALGLLILARILLGGMNGRPFFGMGHRFHHFNPIHEKWMKMTPEEQKEFLKKRHCGHFGHCGRGFGYDFWRDENSEKQD